MYDHSSILIAGILFVSMALTIELGYRIGRRIKVHADEAPKAQINTIQASLLGVLALLLGFTFSLALQRFDSRSEAVVDEANAIGTVYLRAQLLPASIREKTRKLLRDYLDLRVMASVITLVNESERNDLLVQSGQRLDALWEFARQAAELDGRPVTTGLFIQSLNEMIDAYGRRNAALNRHVPELVLFLLFGTLLMAGSIIGYSSGVAGHRTSFVTYIMVTLIVLLVFMIIDLDRPRRGLIEVSQASLTNLQATINAAPEVGR